MSTQAAQIGRVFMVNDSGVICPLQRGILKARRIKKEDKKKNMEVSSLAQKVSEQKN